MNDRNDHAHDHAHGHSHGHSHGTVPDTGPRRFRLRLVVGGLTLLLLALYSAAVSVQERHTTLVTRFGKLDRTLDEPGLHWKLPWPLEAEIAIDRRTHVLESRFTEGLTSDRRAVVLQTFVAWRVEEPELFFRAVGDETRAREILGDKLSAAETDVLAQNALGALVSVDADASRSRAIEEQLLARIEETARDTYGIAIESLGIKRVAFPEANIAAVFDQMRADRKREGDAIRAEGETTAGEIRERTKVEVREMLAEADKEARIIRGRAEADIARALIGIVDLDPEFFAFMVKMNSLEELITNNTALFLQTGQVPFDLFNGERADAAFVGEGGLENGRADGDLEDGDDDGND